MLFWLSSYKISEKKVRVVRWILVISWLILIASLFYDPISSYLTAPNSKWSPLSISSGCILHFQGECLRDKPYRLGTTIFWGMVIPGAVMLLLVFGHETWRRIFPLSFLSQIPRALNIQRQRKKINKQTGKVSYELVRIAENSWLGSNHLYLQFGLLFLGLNLRILLINSNRLLLGIFLILTILAAITVGYLFAGKSWCNYFCPMAPVQMVYNGPRSLLGSEAHQDHNSKITQSTCRTIDANGKEKNACVACQSPCLDIDAERYYWKGLNKPGRKLVQYGYLGLVVGFYLYSWLYSGTLDYYYSGIWTHEENQLITLFHPGFYLNGLTIPIPKIIAVPLTLTLFVGLSYFLCNRLEKAYRSYRIRIQKPFTQKQTQHILFSMSTFVVFNVYFLFGGRPLTRLLSPVVELALNALIIIVSTLWVYRTLGRNEETYMKEKTTQSLRRQLQKLPFDLSKYLDGNSIENLNPDEVHVLAKIIPSFSKETSLQVYQEMLRELLEQGYVSAANSLEALQKTSHALDITEEKHFAILDQLSSENPNLIYSLNEHKFDISKTY